MKNFLFLLFILFSIPVLSQKIVSDSLSKKPISFAEIYSEKGEILGATNYNGEISLNIIDKINQKKIKQIYFNQNNYLNKHISPQELSKLDSVYLIPFQIDKINKLDEIIVTPNRKKKYLKLTAYFRSIQFNNNQPQYYMDGMVEYYVSTQNNKVKIFILKNRSLKDTHIKQIDEKGMIHMNLNIAGVPDLGNFIDYKKLKNEYIINDSDLNFSINKENLEIGKIRMENNNLFLDLEIYSEKRPKVMKLFGVESILKNYTVNAIYSKNESVNILKKILYFKEYRVYDIKQKKDIKYSHINCINEIYITKRELTDIEPESPRNDFYSFNNESNYKDDFWENVGSDYIKPISESVELFIEKNLSKQ